jgi:hypothetical protein
VLECISHGHGMWRGVMVPRHYSPMALVDMNVFSVKRSVAHLYFQFLTLRP